MSLRVPVLYEAIREAKTGGLAPEALTWVFAASTVLVPSGTDVEEDLEGFQPLLFDRDGTAMLTVVTADDVVGDLLEQTPFLIALEGATIMSRLPPNTGIVVNPRSDLSFELPPSVITAFIGRLTSHA